VIRAKVSHHPANLEFARWNDIFADIKITAALLDHIIYHSHLLDTLMQLEDSKRNQYADNPSAITTLLLFPATSHI